MTHLPSLPGDGTLLDVFRAYPDTSRPLLDFHEALMRGPSPLTVTPDHVSPSDARAVLDAGWTEQALHDAAAVCALFSFMNRYVNGLGVTADHAYVDLSGRRLAAGGYARLKAML